MSVCFFHKIPFHSISSPITAPILSNYHRKTAPIKPSINTLHWSVAHSRVQRRYRVSQGGVTLISVQKHNFIEYLIKEDSIFFTLLASLHFGSFIKLSFWSFEIREQGTLQSSAELSLVILPSDNFWKQPPLLHFEHVFFVLKNFLWSIIRFVFISRALQCDVEVSSLLGLRWCPITGRHYLQLQRDADQSDQKVKPTCLNLHGNCCRRLWQQLLQLDRRQNEGKQCGLSAAPDLV